MKTAVEKYGFEPNVHVKIVKQAIYFATYRHNDTNHKYGDASYTIHLSHVVDVAYRFIHLVPLHLRPLVIAACWLHDALEDVRVSYNDVVKTFTRIGVDKETAVHITEIVRAVTSDNRGRTRDERMTPEVYNDIRNVVGARFVKFCDRIANVEFGGKTDMYAKEHAKFMKELYLEEYIDMIDYMEDLYSHAPKKIENDLS